MLKLIVAMGVFFLSLALRAARKLRLTIPALYVLIAAVSTLFTDWVSQHEQIVLWGLYGLLAAVALSWIVTLVNVIRVHCRGSYEADDIAWQIHRAKELGVPLDSIRFDASNNLIDPRTGMPVDFRAGS